MRVVAIQLVIVLGLCSVHVGLAAAQPPQPAQDEFVSAGAGVAGRPAARGPAADHGLRHHLDPGPRLSVVDLASDVSGRARDRRSVAPLKRWSRAELAARGNTTMLDMTAGHFIFIPAVLLFGIVLGWILGSRAAADAYAVELKRREERAARSARRQREGASQS